MPLLSLVALALCRPAAQAANPGRRVALVVGVNTYSNDPGINALSYAVADANSVAEAFNKLKFDVVVKLTTDETEPQLQPTSDNVIQRLELLAKSLKKEDTFVFYFSGHGFQFPNEDGQKETFLATSNALRTGYLTISRTMVSLEVMKKAMSQVKAERRVFIIDACRSNPVKPTATPGTKDPIQGMDDKFKKDLITVQEAGLQNPGQAVLLACKPGASSFEIPTLKHGYYTYFLLKALDQPGSANGNGDILPSTLHAATEQLMADYAAVSGKEQVPDSALTGSLNWSLGRRPQKKVVEPDIQPDPNPQPIPIPKPKKSAMELAWATPTILKVVQTPYPNTDDEIFNHEYYKLRPVGQTRAFGWHSEKGKVVYVQIDLQSIYPSENLGSGPAWKYALSPSGRFYAVVNGATITVYKFPSCERYAECQVPRDWNWWNSISVSDSGDYATISGGRYGNATALIIATKSGNVVKSFDDKSAALNALSMPGRDAFSIWGETTLSLYSVPKADSPEEATRTVVQSFQRSCQVDNYIYVRIGARRINRIDARSGQVATILKDSTSIVGYDVRRNGFDVSPDHTMAALVDPGRVSLVSLVTGEELGQIPFPNSKIDSLCFNRADPTVLGVALANGEIHICRGVGK